MFALIPVGFNNSCIDFGAKAFVVIVIVVLVVLLIRIYHNSAVLFSIVMMMLLLWWLSSSSSSSSSLLWQLWIMAVAVHDMISLLHFPSTRSGEYDL